MHTEAFLCFRSNLCLCECDMLRIKGAANVNVTLRIDLYSWIRVLKVMFICCSVKEEISSLRWAVFL